MVLHTGGRRESNYVVCSVSKTKVATNTLTYLGISVARQLNRSDLRATSTGLTMLAPPKEMCKKAYSMGGRCLS